MEKDHGIWTNRNLVQRAFDTILPQQLYLYVNEIFAGHPDCANLVAAIEQRLCPPLSNDALAEQLQSVKTVLEAAGIDTTEVDQKLADLAGGGS